MAAPIAKLRNRDQLCTAHRSNGNGLCNAYRIAGSTVCAQHGGKSPQVRRKAQERLDRAADSIIATLVEIATNERIDPEARIKACKELLAHTHEVLTPGQRVHVTGNGDLRPKVLDLLANPPTIDGDDQVTVITSLPIQNPLPANKKPSARSHRGLES